MAMLTLNGQVLNLFETPPFTDKKTGEVTPARHRVQIMAENMLQNGEKRMDLVNLTVDDVTPYKALQGRLVRVPVGVFAAGRDLTFYALKGHKPEAVAVPGAVAPQGAAPRA